MPTKRKPKILPLPPAAPDSPRALLADRISRLACKWLDLYEAALDDAARARASLKEPPAPAKSPDVASIKEVATVLSLCIQLDELAATGGHIDEAQSRRDFEAVERALSEATL